jgi:tetratricopeptide (TPR) repeat protein
VSGLPEIRVDFMSSANVGAGDVGRPARHLIGVLAICSVGILAYSNTLQVPFVFDDEQNIQTNAAIRLTEFDFAGLWAAAFESPGVRPVASASFALNYLVGGYDVAGYHVLNLAIHLANGILVYLLALQILRQLDSLPGQKLPRVRGDPTSLMSLFAALIFVAHPLQTQAITYVVQRMTSLAVVFYLTSLLLYILGRARSGPWKRWALFGAAFASGVLALGSKQIAATLPVIVLLYEWYFPRDLSGPWFKKNSKVFAGLAVLLALIGFAYLAGHPSALSFENREFTASERVLTQFRVIIFYITLLLYPAPSRLSLTHFFPTSHSFLDPPTTILSLFAIVGLLVLAVRLARSQRLLSFCLLWFFIHLAIESSFVSLEMVYEHRLYLPMFGFALAVTYALAFPMAKHRAWAVALGAVVVASLGTATYLRNRVWQDPVTLWSDVVSKGPQDHRAQNNLGAALEKRGKADTAIHHFQAAVQIKPNYARAHNNLGVALETQGEREEAIRHYREAVRIAPGYSEAHTNLALALETQGDHEAALRHFSEALRLSPNYAKAHYSLGVTLVAAGRVGEAIQHFSEAVRIHPAYSLAHHNLGTALLDMGRLDEAIEPLETALRLDPEFAATHSMLGVARGRQGRFEEAASHFARALEIDPDLAQARAGLDLLARIGEQRSRSTSVSPANASRPEAPGSPIPRR